MSSKRRPKTEQQEEWEASWDGDHPNARDCSREECDSARMNIVSLGGDPKHPVAICANCGRVNLDGGDRR